MSPDYDVIIIGAGLGGLTAGARLAKAGKKILVVEQHYKVGGCATTFKRGDFTIEVGLHEMDGLDENDIKTGIFRELGIFEEVEFIKLPEFYRFTNGRTDIVIPDNASDAIKVLTEKFPDEEKGIKKFFAVMRKIHREVFRFPKKRWIMLLLLPIFPFIFLNLLFRSRQTLGAFLDSIIKDEELKLVLSANLGYYHDDPYTMSLLFFSAAQGSFFTGANYIKGGSQKLSDCLAKVITDNGGQILLSHQVTEIITQNQTAVGIKFKPKSSPSKEKEAYAKKIIANAAVPQVVNHLLPVGSDKAFKKKVNSLEIACSIVTLYLGFYTPLKKLGNHHYSTFVFDESVTALSQLKRPGLFDKMYVLADYSQIDSALAPAGKSVGMVCTLDYLSNWENLSKEAYKAKKEDTAQALIRKLEKLIPGITKEIEYYELATPRTIVRYTSNPGGSVYGFAQIPSQAGMKRLDVRSPVKNLYFASAWTRPGGGFTGAIMSGNYCAQEVLRN